MLNSNSAWNLLKRSSRMVLPRIFFHFSCLEGSNNKFREDGLGFSLPLISLQTCNKGNFASPLYKAHPSLMTV